EDIVRANLLALDRGENGTYNLGSGVETSDRAVFEAVRDAVGADVEPIHEPVRPGEIHRIALDASRARAELGWQPSVSFAEGGRRRGRSCPQSSPLSRIGRRSPRRLLCGDPAALLPRARAARHGGRALPRGGAVRGDVPRPLRR